MGVSLIVSVPLRISATLRISSQLRQCALFNLHQLVRTMQVKVGVVLHCVFVLDGQ